MVQCFGFGALTVHWGFIGITEKKMETTILGSSWDDGKENGNYRDYRDYIGFILGLYRIWGRLLDHFGYPRIGP